MNLYILHNVLYDYSAGMAVICAKDLDQCKELFLTLANGNQYREEMETEWNNLCDDDIIVIKNVDREAGVVTYIGGGA